MIISASRRTDIPAFYGEWFINRIKEGFVYVRNPFNYHAVSKIPLTAELVDMIVFWTKDPKNFMEKLKIVDELGYAYYFQFTLNPYDNKIEQGLRSKKDIIDTFIELSKRLGKNKVIWRYDPILFYKAVDIKYHVNEFKKYVEILSDYTDTVIISFLDDYKKIGFKKQEFRKPNMDEMLLIGTEFFQIAKNKKLLIKTCAEEIIFKSGIVKASCVDSALISKILGEEIKASKDKNQRKECLCVESIDIGEYDSCLHLCQYCYANCNNERIRTNSKLHNSKSPLLIGELMPSDIVKDRRVKSIKTGQTIFLI